MEYEITKSEISEDKIISYSNFLSSAFIVTKKFTPEFIRWQYVQNPVGNVIGFDAFFDKELIAHSTTIPVLYKIDDKEIKGLLAINTATHPAHQGKGLFTTLAKKTYEEAKKSGYEFVIAFANANSTYGFLNKLGFNFVCQLDVKIGIGEILIDNDYNYLMKSIWSKETLLWRLSNPSASYFFNTSNYIITPARRFGIDAQLMHHNELSSVLKLKNKKNLLKVWIGLAQKKHQKGFFIDLPQKFKASPLNFIYKDLTGNMPHLKKENVFFELIDFDAY